MILMILNMPERNPNRHWVTQIWYWYSNVLYIHIISYFNMKFGLFCCQCQVHLCGVCLCSVSPVRRARVAPMAAFTAAWLSRYLFDCLELWGVLRCRHVAMVKTCSKHKHIKRKRMDTQRLEPQSMQSLSELNYLIEVVEGCFFVPWFADATSPIHTPEALQFREIVVKGFPQKTRPFDAKESRCC